MANPLVSVIVAVFNQQDFVLETVNSVLNQTYTNLEVIVVDDGSTDQSLERLHSLKDSRLNILSLKHAGEANCKNHGFNNSAGEFVGFIDGDDMWEPTKVESHVEALSKDVEAGLAYSFTSFIDEQGQTLHEEPPYEAHKDCYRELLKNNFMKSGSNAIHKRASLVGMGSYDPNCAILIDWDLYLRHSKHCSFALVPQHLVRYRQHSNQNSLNVSEMERSARKLFLREFKQNEKCQLSEQLRQESFDNFYSYLGQQCRRNLVSPKTGILRILEAARILAKAKLYSRSGSTKDDLRLALSALFKNLNLKQN